jgi:DNA-binding LacI/PurR family transcriptional regulator
VIVNRDPGVEGVIVVKTGQETEGYMATRHLLDLGHRRIGLVNSVRGRFTSDNLRSGYRKALGEHRTEPDPGWEILRDPSVVGGREAALALLASHPTLTAVITWGELMAAGVLQACRELGRQVPTDLAVVSCGGSFLGTITTPTLSTVDTPVYEPGKACVDVLVERLEHGSLPSKALVFESRLVVRGSSAAPADSSLPVSRARPEDGSEPIPQ